MADFRRSIHVLAMIALLLGVVATASAQAPSFQCTANAAVPPVVRAEGVTEGTGDLLLNCTGGIPTPIGAQIPPVNVQIFLNTNVTSKLLVSATGLTEALLLLDEPGVNTINPTRSPCFNAPAPCTNIGNGAGYPSYYGTGTQVFPFNGTFNNKNIFQGQLAPGRNDSLLWLGVPIDPPGTSGTRIIRITNVRAHAAQLGTGSVPVEIKMLVTATGTFSVPINNPNQTVAVIQKSMAFSVTSVKSSLQQCFSQSNTKVATLNYQELLASAFKQYNVASSDASPATAAAQNTFVPSLNTETLDHSPTELTGTFAGAGLPNFGTRLQAVFNNVPAGVTLTVDTSSLVAGTGPGGLKDAARLVVNGSTAFSAASSATIALSGGTGTATWEVTQSEHVSFVTHSFGVYVTYTANPGANSPAIGPTATVNGSYSPISTTFTSVSSPIPRFVDTSVATNIFAIVPCVTNLLFPFVSNQLGFDTGLAISSTSTDPFGTSPQSGTCTLNWYGANAPAATLTPTVASGTTYTTLASLAAPNFQGYMIAVCRFQYGHGFAFVSDLGARNIAMGYLALVIPDTATPRHAAPFPCSGTGAATLAFGGCIFSGEQLGQ